MKGKTKECWVVRKKNDNFNNTLEKVKIKYIQKFNIMSTVGRNGGKYHTEN